MRPSLELADIVRAHEADFIAARGGLVSGAERRVLKAIASCRTAALGGHVQECDQCGHTVISYNSCRNRHCPKCQESARTKWLNERERDLLPVEYFHVVFTVPHEIAAVAFQNKKVVYDILFLASSETLLRVAADPKHLGAEIGVLSLLHTWGQNLEHHPHVHCVVPGGGLSSNASRWVSCRPGFFLPVRVLSRLFRGKFLHHLQNAFDRGQLGFHGEIAHLEDHSAFRAYLKPLYEKDWFVYSKEPFGGPAHVLRYLSRYTNRVAISNSRLIKLDSGRVTFWWKDYAHSCQRKTMTLAATEFLRRFLLHLLPRGFVRIRNYGFLANRHRKKKIELCRRLLGVHMPTEANEAALETDEPHDRKTKCPSCNRGTMVSIFTFERGESIPHPYAVPAYDTS